MEQKKLFDEDIYEAFVSAVQALGGAKRVGHALWPAKSIEEAGKQLNRCLSSTTDHKLSLDEIMWILCKAAEKDCHVIVDRIAKEAGYEWRKVTPEEREAELETKILLALDQQAELMKEFKDLQQRKRLRAVS